MCYIMDGFGGGQEIEEVDLGDTKQNECWLTPFLLLLMM